MPSITKSFVVLVCRARLFSECQPHFSQTTLPLRILKDFSFYYSITIHSHYHPLLFQDSQPQPAFVTRMRYKPTKTELARSHSFLTNQPSDLRDTSLYVSGSKWSQKHLEALRVVSVDAIGLNKLIPSRYIPHANKKGMSNLEHIVQLALIHLPFTSLQGFASCQ